MAHYIDKAALVAEIMNCIDRCNIKKRSCPANTQVEAICDNKIHAYTELLSFLDTFEVKEVSEELAETYIQVFEKKFPILPTLKGKQLSKFKNFLNKCQQIFGLQEFGIHPIQAKLFEKLALLWTAWGAENLQGIGQVEDEPDEVKEVDLEEELNNWRHEHFHGRRDNDYSGEYLERSSQLDIARHFVEIGLKAAQKRK